MSGYGDTQYFQSIITTEDVDIKAAGAYLGVKTDIAGLSVLGTICTNDTSKFYFSSKDDDGITMMAEPFMNRVAGSEKMNDEVTGRAVEFEIQAVGLDDIGKVVTAEKIDDLHGKRRFVYMYDVDTGFIEKSCLVKINSLLDGKGNATPIWKLSGTQEDDNCLISNTIPLTA